MKPPPVPREVIEQVRAAGAAGDLDTAMRLLAEHSPKAWKRAQWRDVTETRSALLRGAWAAFREDLGPRRRMQREKTAAGVWSVSAKNDHGARIEVAIVTCAAPRTIDDKPQLHVDLRAPGLVGERVRALVAHP